MQAWADAAFHRLEADLGQRHTARRGLGDGEAAIAGDRQRRGRDECCERFSRVPWGVASGGHTREVSEHAGEAVGQPLAKHAERAAALALDEHLIDRLAGLAGQPVERERDGGIVMPGHEPVSADVEHARSRKAHMRAQRAACCREEPPAATGAECEFRGHREARERRDPMVLGQEQRHERRHDRWREGVAETAGQFVAAAIRTRFRQ